MKPKLVKENLMTLLEAVTILVNPHAYADGERALRILRAYLADYESTFADPPEHQHQWVRMELCAACGDARGQVLL